MNDNIKNILGVSLAVGVLVFSFSSLGFAYAFLKSREPVKTFAVSSEGEILALPDIAGFNYDVITEGKEDLPALQEENSRISNLVNEYLKKQGVAQEDIKTIGYNISPRYQNFPCQVGSPIGIRVCPPSEIVGYTINHSVQVKVRELSRVGEFLAGVVETGANSASSLTFSIDDIEKIQHQARSIAIEKAKIKAKEIADSAGVRLGKIVSISESFQIPFEFGAFAKAASIDGSSPAIPPTIEPGSQEVKANVMITYEIR